MSEKIRRFCDVGKFYIGNYYSEVYTWSGAHNFIKAVYEEGATCAKYFARTNFIIFISAYSRAQFPKPLYLSVRPFRIPLPKHSVEWLIQDELKTFVVMQNYPPWKLEAKL